jgi:hypothetical protein
MFEHVEGLTNEIKLAQMKIVERVVRPIQANIVRKRRVRDEMFAHLSAIYDEELIHSGDPTKAVNAAADRFGDPTELTAELQATVPWREQFEYQVETWFGWHPPETALSWMSRVAIQLGVLMLLVCILVTCIAMREFGWSYSLWLTVRPIAAAALVLPICVFSYGVCYYKIRDRLFGVFGLQKSWTSVVLWAALLNFTTVAAGAAFLAISYGGLDPLRVAIYPIVVFGLIWTGSAIVIAPIFGPQEIRDTTWALLDLSDHPTAA